MPDNESEESIDAAFPFFQRARHGDSHLYNLRCPQCGTRRVCTLGVQVDQDGKSTTVNRDGDFLDEKDTDDLPGACVSLVFECVDGHQFCVGLMHDGERVRIYAGKPETKIDWSPLWVRGE